MHTPLSGNKINGSYMICIRNSTTIKEFSVAMDIIYIYGSELCGQERRLPESFTHS